VNERLFFSWLVRLIELFFAGKTTAFAFSEFPSIDRCVHDHLRHGPLAGKIAFVLGDAVVDVSDAVFIKHVRFRCRKEFRPLEPGSPYEQEDVVPSEAPRFEEGLSALSAATAT
jgi:hypothetical protein